MCLRGETWLPHVNLGTLSKEGATGDRQKNYRRLLSLLGVELATHCLGVECLGP